MCLQTLLISFSLVINVADTVPRYDLKPTCRAAVDLAAGTEGLRVAWLARMRHARAWQKTGSKIPIAERSQCIATMARGGFPSYVELVVCIEMMSDLRVHQAEERATNAKSKNKKP